MTGRGAKRQGESGFTLMELLVAMAILVIITMIVAQVFQQANVAWDTGMKKSETTMKGRAIADFMAQELSRAAFLPDHPDFNVSGQNADFWILDDAEPGRRSPRHITYNGVNRTVSYLPSDSESSALADNVKSVQFDCDALSGSNLPPTAVVTVTITDSKGVDQSFTSTAYFQNRDRHRQ